MRLIEINPKDFHHGGTRNLAAEIAKGDYLVFLAQDAIPKDESWLRNLIRNLEDPEVPGVYGRQIPKDDATPMERHWLAYFYPDNKMVIQSENSDRTNMT